MIVMQLASEGDLYNYLQKYFANITWQEKLSILLIVSTGYLYCNIPNYLLIIVII